MTAAEALRLARAAGVAVVVEGERVVLRAARQPPDDLLALLKAHKSEIVAMLRPAPACAQCGGGPGTDPPTDAPTVKVIEAGTVAWLHVECADFRHHYGKRWT